MVATVNDKTSESRSVSFDMTLREFNPESSFTVKISSTATGELFITKSLFEPSEPDVAGLDNVKVDAFKAASFIVPVFKASELVST